jgi:ATP-dependent 26S proteasome regulatory subunit
VVLVPGAAIAALAAACDLARRLAPATVVLEDVDLVAEERTMFGHGQNPMLAALLNEIDTVDADADVLFLLTTNRADLLEPALASRPGRVDQAVEVAVPDAECRRRLLELYGEGLVIPPGDVDEVVDRMDGVSAAFVKELTRRALLIAAVESVPATAVHVRRALDEMYEDGATLTRTLLGASPATEEAESAFDTPPGLVIPAEIRQMLEALD